MKISDYIINFLIKKGITDVFGYPGGMVTHLMDSFDKQKDKIKVHVNYHEQASSFCACGYAQASNKVGVAFATSGPGATNLITGIANAYFDSIPCMFITGQVNTYEAKNDLLIRQKGFQETDIVSIVKSITKYAIKIERECDVVHELEKAYQICTSGRPGPVLIDIPMNIQRAEIDVQKMITFKQEKKEENISNEIKNSIFNLLKTAKKPVILAGNGINIANVKKEFIKFVNEINIPVVTSMLSVDVLPSKSPINFGFIGAYGKRYSNFIIQNSDLIVSLGSRLDYRQTGNDLSKFAPDAKIIRIDVDEKEFSNKIEERQIDVLIDLKNFFDLFDPAEIALFNHKYIKWVEICATIKSKLSDIDKQYETDVIKEISKQIPNNFLVTTDVGQNQVWVPQSFEVKDGQRILFSGGHGAMGYSLPAGIGAYYGAGQNIICFNGDGGIQMNIQELLFVANNKLPIKIMILNNNSLGMIRHFQEMYFESNFTLTKSDTGYKTSNFENLALAYGLKYIKICSIDDASQIKSLLLDDQPYIFEVLLSDTTYVFPKLAMGRPINDQEPLLDRELFNNLIEICNI